MIAEPATETIAFRMRIDPRYAQEYRRRHDNIWPDMADVLTAAGAIDYRIFLDRETGFLFAVLTRRVDHGFDSLPGNPVVLRWWTMMADLMPTGPSGAPESWPLEEVFHLSASKEESLS
jgi:L-rhamnose mutarotase